MTAFEVQTASFAGPIELLLEMIEKRKLHISDVSLSEVADNYIKHIDEMKNLPIAQTANFILVASTLILIKSLALLPSLQLTEEEETSIEDLKRRLEIYKDIRKKARLVKEQFGRQIIFGREQPKNVEAVFSPHQSITSSSVLAAIKGVIKNLPKLEVIPETIIKKVLSLEEMINNLTERIKKGLKMNFSEFSEKGKGDKITVIVGFLAMLELVRLGTIMVSQNAHFQEIEMESRDLGTPDYG